MTLKVKKPQNILRNLTAAACLIFSATSIQAADWKVATYE